MATAAPSERESKVESKSNGFDPDSFRMTVGEHLEELRGRLVKGLVGFFVAFAVCYYFSDYTINFFCGPLIKVLKANKVNAQLIAPDVTEGFMVAIRVSLITGAAVAGPWMLYQLWQFVAAGLYPHERKYVTKYMPLSLVLLAAGMVFVYLVVLPFTLSFFIRYIVDMPLHMTEADAAQVAATSPASQPAVTFPIIPSFDGVPKGVPEGGMFYDRSEERLKAVLGGVVRVLPFNSTNLVAPEIELGKYIDLVVMMLVSVGIAFQLPLVVLLLERIGIVEVADLRASRRYVYFAIVVISAVISPGDAITVTVALVGPLILLYELGIVLAVFGKKDEQQPA